MARICRRQHSRITNYVISLDLYLWYRSKPRQPQQIWLQQLALRRCKKIKILRRGKQVDLLRHRSGQVKTLEGDLWRRAVNYERQASYGSWLHIVVCVTVRAFRSVVSAPRPNARTRKGKAQGDP